MQIFGWIGCVCFSLCAIPQAYRSWCDGHSRGLSWAFVWLWLVGEIAMLLYVLPTWDAPLIANYLFNLAFLLVIVFFKFRD